MQGKPNHLAGEKSPYLLQHAFNPVDWYPWGEAAFAKARKEGKPIFLSIGYSTCHWCHVMERESFSDADTAGLLNANFVPIKVDREERPDVDRIYMSAVQSITGQGGWPLNVFLTPELKPFFGGTYFPPAPRYGHPGFPQLLQRIDQLWRTHKEDLSSDADKLAQAVAAMGTVKGRSAPPEAAFLEGGFKAFAGAFEPDRGGFGGAPKFPMPVNQAFLLRYYARTGEKKALDMAAHTLKAIAAGGVYDQVGGGFHRYSVDDRWFVPHFEKMLYDNAQLAANCVEAYQAGGDPDLARVARETFEYVSRDMTHPDGGFFSAEDADSVPPEEAAEHGAETGHEHKKEGAFYLWSLEELTALLGKDAEVVAYLYGIRPDGNIADDPHGEFGGKNLPFAAHSVEQTAARFGRQAEDIRSLLGAAREELLKARSRRPRPSLDDKILTSWNGLMISAFARGQQALGDPAYGAAARKAAAFLRRNLYDGKERRLYHRWRDGERSIPGNADDYAFLVQGLLDLYETTFDPAWLQWAVELTETQLRLFKGPEGGFFLTAADHDPDLIARVMEDSDNVEPCASSVAALNLLRLAQITERKDFQDAAEQTLTLFGAQLRAQPRSLPALLCALDYSLSEIKQVVIAAEGGDSRAMVREAQRRFVPAKALLCIRSGEERREVAKLAPWVKGLLPVDGKPAAYVCVDRVCALPSTDPASAFARIGR